MKQHTPTLLASAFATLISLPAIAESPVSEDDELLNLSLEELISLDVPDVTSVSRKKQRLMDSAAAVYVITSEDIQRSGVTSIPEALRMVPGMQVARMNGNTWSISTRGFNYIFANKLLVLIDGRTVYSPLFSGVNWDVQDTILEDIARIEVIRGPGAALWGANAVSGVINIITKHAGDTQGGLLTTGFGSEEKAFATYRYGGEMGEDAYFKTYYKVFHRDGMLNFDGSDAADDWKIHRAGFRTDWKATNGADVTVQGDIYTGSTRPPMKVYAGLEEVVKINPNLSRDQKGGNLIGNWKYKYDNSSDISLKAYYDRYENYDYRAISKRDMGDIEFQHHFKPWEKHDLIWGGSFRITQYNLSDMNQIELKGGSRTDRLYSAFIQGDITFNPEWNLTFSSRFEHNSFTGFEVQPNARVTWKATENRTFWSSVSRAVKTPSISETSVTSREFIYVNFPISKDVDPRSRMAISGNPSLKSEELLALEFGYREQFNDIFRIDITTFLNKYDNLLSYINSNPGECDRFPDDTTKVMVTDIYGKLIPVCSLGQKSINGENVHVVEYSATLDNKLSATAFGFEITADWQVKDWWKLQFNYSYFGIDASRPQEPINENYLVENEGLLEDLSASHTANFRSSINLPNQWYFDFWIRYIDKITEAHFQSKGKAKAYTNTDIRIAKKYGDNLEISLIGQNIFDRSRLEFDEIFSGQSPTEVERAWYLQLRWQH